jgi:hypothetical protein
MRKRIYQEVWDAQREVAILTARWHTEQDVLASWQRRLELRTAYEQSHSGPSQLPALRQACAAAHALVAELERQLHEATIRLRILRAQDGGDVQPWSALK